MINWEFCCNPSADEQITNSTVTKTVKYRRNNRKQYLMNGTNQNYLEIAGTLGFMVFLISKQG